MQRLGPGFGIIHIILTILFSLPLIPAYSQSGSNSNQYGYIKGSVISPSDGLAREEVCAIDVNDTAIKYCTTSDDDNKYSLKVPAGVYYVCAWVLIHDTAYNSETKEHMAYYTDAVLCGFTVQCGDPCGDRSVLLKIQVEQGKTVNHIDPTDWYWHELLIIKKDQIISIKK